MVPQKTSLPTNYEVGFVLSVPSIEYCINNPQLVFSDTVDGLLATSKLAATNERSIIQIVPLDTEAIYTFCCDANSSIMEEHFCFEWDITTLVETSNSKVKKEYSLLWSSFDHLLDHIGYWLRRSDENLSDADVIRLILGQRINVYFLPYPPYFN